MRLPFFALPALFVLLFALPVHAGTMQEVAVESDGKDAEEARTLAITKGQIQAFNTIAGQQLSAAQAKQIADTTKPEQISDAVEGFEVVNEKIADKHYAATFRFTFNDDKLVTIFRQTISAGAPIAAPASAPLLVVPLLKEGGAILLWEENNGWRNAWNHIVPSGNSSLLRVPLGDLQDIQAINAAAVLAGNCTYLSELARRYGADEVMVALAENVSASNASAVSVKVQRLCSTQPSEPTRKRYDAQSPGETVDMLYHQAARDITSHMKIRAASTGLKSPEQNVQTMLMLAPISSTAQWVTIRNRLKSLGMISEVNLLAISATQADISVNFKGKPSELQEALEQQGLHVTPMDKYWALYVR